VGGSYVYVSKGWKAQVWVLVSLKMLSPMAVLLCRYKLGAISDPRGQTGLVVRRGYCSAF
jgi:hypothetical protein